MSSVAVPAVERPARREYGPRQAFKLTWLVMGVVPILLLPLYLWLANAHYQGEVEQYQQCVEAVGADSPFCGDRPKPDLLTWMNVALGVFWALWGTVFLIMAFRTRLIVGEDGIEYTDGFGRVRGAWPDVTRITQERSGILRVDFLYLRESRFDAPGWLAWMVGPKIRQRVPISLFGRDWRSTQLGDDLRHHAPQLFRHEGGDH